MNSPSLRLYRVSFFTVYRHLLSQNFRITEQYLFKSTRGELAPSHLGIFTDMFDLRSFGFGTFR